ncbi:unnamed protein product, partial [Amoebophrya sp. A120]
SFVETAGDDFDQDIDAAENRTTLSSSRQDELGTRSSTVDASLLRSPPEDRAPPLTYNFRPTSGSDGAKGKKNRAVAASASASSLKNSVAGFNQQRQRRRGATTSARVHTRSPRSWSPTKKSREGRATKWQERR